MERANGGDLMTCKIRFALIKWFHVFGNLLGQEKIKEDSELCKKSQ